eukprot:7372955-Pyramimonas_sp.AAC.1
MEDTFNMRVLKLPSSTTSLLVLAFFVMLGVQVSDATPPHFISSTPFALTVNATSIQLELQLDQA